MKYSRRRLLGVLWLLLAFFGFLLLRSCGSDRTAAAATNEQRVAYLNSLGWQVEPEPVETLSLTLPKELEEPYQSYNVLQRAQGFDLEPCCGKTVERCTYTVKNHPSGKVDPSPEDQDITKRLQQAGEILGIDVLDHLVIAKAAYYSFLEHGLM